MTCIHLSQGMLYLCAGYINGAIAVWDLTTSKLEKIITDVHVSEVISAKIFDLNIEDNSISIISMEINGPIQNTKIIKNLILSSTVEKLPVFTKRFKNKNP